VTDEDVTMLVNLHAILWDWARGEDRGPKELTVPRSICVAEFLPFLKDPAMEVVYSINSTIAEAIATLKGGDSMDIIPAIWNKVLHEVG
jgi:hypothetical protein